MKTYGERLRQALKFAGNTQSGLAREIGVRPQAIQHLCRPTAQWSKHTHAIAKALGVSADWLATGAGSMQDESALREQPATYPQKQIPGSPIIEWEDPDDLPADEYVFVQRRRVRPSAGDGTLVFDEEPGPPLAFTTRWVKSLGAKKSNLVVVEAQGDSMEPGIRDGDAIMVDIGQTNVVDGYIYVIRYRDELRVKRLFMRYDGALVVRSDNSAKYPDEVVPSQDLDGQVQVVGRVVWRAGGVI